MQKEYGKYTNNWEIVLSHLKNKPADGLEIGSFEGRSAVWALENILTHPSSTLTCIDTFNGGEEYEKLGFETSNTKNVFIKNIAATGVEDKVKVLPGYSYIHLAKLVTTGQQFDYIYIDASHVAVDVLRDSVLAFIVLKKGGVLIFDDYYWDEVDGTLNQPKIAIDAFLDIYSGRYSLLNRELGAQIIGGKEQIYLVKTNEIGLIERLEDLRGQL